jgi:broad specificity phosphatase PhoE
MPSKRILAIRHGESEWNVLRRIHKTEEERYIDVMYTPDCSITAKGSEQTQRAGRELDKLLSSSSLETSDVKEEYIMIVSPLQRALQTARNILSTCSHPPRRVCVHPGCTEILGDACDIGTAPNILRRLYPEFDFDLVKDEYWWPFGRSGSETWDRMRERRDGGIETEDMIQRRMADFVRYLHTLNDIDDGVDDVSTIVIVCHSEVIWWLTSQVQNGKRFGMWTQNGEIVEITKHVVMN